MGDGDSEVDQAGTLQISAIDTSAQAEAFAKRIAEWPPKTFFFRAVGAAARPITWRRSKRPKP